MYHRTAWGRKGPSKVRRASTTRLACVGDAHQRATHTHTQAGQAAKCFVRHHPGVVPPKKKRPWGKIRWPDTMPEACVLLVRSLYSSGYLATLKENSVAGVAANYVVTLACESRQL